MAKKYYNNDLEELTALDGELWTEEDLDGVAPYLETGEAFEELAQPRRSTAGAWTSLILGIIGSLSWIVPIVGLPITIVGTVFGAMNMGNKRARGAAIGGFVVSLVFMLASIAKGVIDIIRWFRTNK